MMPENFHIVVEGEEDVRFLKGYLGFLLGLSISGKCFNNLNGVRNLDGQTPSIEEVLRKRVKVLIILDANSDHQKRRQETQKILEKRIPNGGNLPLFLFPDNQSSGALEDLLEQIIIPEHKGIFACFEDYKKCLKERSPDYTLPSKKGKVYAYEQAIGALRGKDKENQFDSKYWVFGHPALEPLKKFLTEHIE